MYRTVNRFADFYRQNKERLFAYLLRMTGDYCLAGDLVQESFARYLGRYNHDDPSRPLLYTIARNAALDAVRKQTAESLDGSDYEDPCKNQEQQVMDRQGFDRMLAAIGRLAPLDRDLISMVATADLTYREIGSLLNLSEANVKVRVHRARTKLKEILGSGGQ